MLYFRWLHDLITLGLRRPIEKGDIYRTLKSHESKELTNKFSLRWDRERAINHKPKLIKILQQIYAKRVIGASIVYTMLNVTIRYFRFFTFHRCDVCECMYRYDFWQTGPSSRCSLAILCHTWRHPDYRRRPIVRHVT